MNACERRIRFLVLGLYCLYVQCLVSCTREAKIATNLAQTVASIDDGSATVAVKNPECRARYSKLDDELLVALRAAGHDDFIGDLCNEQAALQTRDVTACASLPTQHWRTHCVTRIAAVRQEPDLCPWDSPLDIMRGRDPLCLARAADRSLLCSAVTRGEDSAECMRIFRLTAPRSDAQASLLIREQPRTAESDARRGVVLLQEGAKRTYLLGDASDLTLVAPAPLAGARIAVVVVDGTITKLVWRAPSAATLAVDGEQLKLKITLFKAPLNRSDPFHLVAEGIAHVGKSELPISLELHTYLRDIVVVPKVEPATPRR